MFQVGQIVSKINVNGKIGSAREYEIATVTPIAELDSFSQRLFGERAVDGAVYTLRKVGGKGKGGTWYTVAELVAAS